MARHAKVDEDGMVETGFEEEDEMTKKKTTKKKSGNDMTRAGARKLHRTLGRYLLGVGVELLNNHCRDSKKQPVPALVDAAANLIKVGVEVEERARKR